MAYNTKAYATTLESLTVNDYTVTPNSLALVLASETMERPEIDSVMAEEISKASSTGVARHAYLVTGKELAQKGSCTIICGQLNNDSDTGQESLFRGLAADDLSATAFSGWTVTNQLTGGGKSQVKLIYTITNSAGSATVYTYPVCIDKVTPTAVGKARAYKIDWTLVGVVARS
jgi:hypothetical protein